jgi:hypothetical protein
VWVEFAEENEGEFRSSVNFAEENEGEFRSSDKLWHKNKNEGLEDSEKR